MGDYRTTTGEAHPLPNSEKRRRLMRVGIRAAGLAVVLGLFGGVLRVERRVPAAGYVTAEDYAQVRPTIAGVVASILAPSGAHVAVGADLVQLDASEQQATLEGARSQLRKATADLSRREAEIAQQKKLLSDQIALARLRVKNAQIRLARAQELETRGLGAPTTVEDIGLQLEIARAELTSLETRDLTAYARELEVLRHEVESRSDSVARAEAQVRQRRIAAPIGGQVVRYDFVVGELVRPDTVLYEVFGGKTQILKLRIAERYATLVQPGQAYRARLTSYGGLRRTWFRGKVQFLRNVIQMDGQRSYRTVYCTFDAGAHDVPPGTTAEAKIAAGRVSLWAYLLGL
jgi:multidrug resistance efflux pump